MDNLRTTAISLHPICRQRTLGKNQKKCWATLQQRKIGVMFFGCGMVAVAGSCLLLGHGGGWGLSMSETKSLDWFGASGSASWIKSCNNSSFDFEFEDGSFAATAALRFLWLFVLVLLTWIPYDVKWCWTTLNDVERRWRNVDPTLTRHWRDV